MLLQGPSIFEECCWILWLWIYGREACFGRLYIEEGGFASLTHRAKFLISNRRQEVKIYCVRENGYYPFTSHSRCHVSLQMGMASKCFIFLVRDHLDPLN